VYLESAELEEEQQITSDLDISYKLLHRYGYDAFDRASRSETIIIDSKIDRSILGRFEASLFFTNLIHDLRLLKGYFYYIKLRMLFLHIIQIY